MAATRERARPHGDGGFNGEALLSEQTELLLESTPADINFLQFLRLRLNAQQRATAQRNYWQRVHRDDVESVGSGAMRSRGHSILLASASVNANDSNGDVGDNHSSTRPRTAGASRASLSAADGEDTAAESSISSYTAAAAVKRDALLRVGSHKPLTPLPTSAVQRHSFDDVPASVSERRGTDVSVEFERDSPMPEATELAATSTTDGSDDGDRSSQRPTSRPPPDEDVYVVPAFATSGSSVTTAPIADERLAMASGKPQVPVGADELRDVVLEPCPHCSRTFAPGRLQRHAALCGRQQQTTATKARGDGKDSKASSGRKKTDRTASTASGGPSHRSADAAVKTEQWRRQSAQLRNAMAGVGATADNDDRVPCPSCNRRFSGDAAARHIPSCAARSHRTA
ncbi:zinc-finger of a C2HC-type [Novymonas esmeraldas]|uniref:Zinc-finger of a C2HC-type n=1 Tax=Novymonas esmeraldas TaxID=1808958 RepID=A0AAW0ETN2_9TRYP